MKKYLWFSFLVLALVACEPQGGKNEPTPDPVEEWDEVLPENFTLSVTHEYIMYSDPKTGKTITDSAFVFTPCDESYEYFFMYERTDTLTEWLYPDLLEYSKKLVSSYVHLGEGDRLPVYKGKHSLPYGYLDKDVEFQFVWVGMSSLSHRTYGEWGKLTYTIH